MLTELTLTHFRNISKAFIQPVAGINLFFGENGSGKTSLLEAIHLLAMGRSFRTRNLKHIPQHDTEQCQIFARINQTTPVGFQFNMHTGLQIRLNNAPLKKLSELASYLPLQYIPANCHEFFDSGPRFRRKVVDWGLFHVEQSFFYHWQSYKKALSQRNAALRSGKNNDEIQVWDKWLISHGLALTNLRKDYLEKLKLQFERWFNMLCKDFIHAKYHLRYLSGWPKDREYNDVLRQTLDRDKALGYTRSGPHAADWSIKIDDHEPSELLSRGQQKLFFLAITLAQISMMQELQKHNSILLIDDLSSELDYSHQMLAIEAIQSLNIQSFITAINSEMSASFDKEKRVGMFHVKQGEVEALTALSTSSNT